MSARVVIICQVNWRFPFASDNPGYAPVPGIIITSIPFHFQKCPGLYNTFITELIRKPYPKHTAPNMKKYLFQFLSLSLPPHPQHIQSGFPSFLFSSYLIFPAILRTSNIHLINFHLLKLSQVKFYCLQLKNPKLIRPCYSDFALYLQQRTFMERFYTY